MELFCIPIEGIHPTRSQTQRVATTAASSVPPLLQATFITSQLRVCRAVMESVITLERRYNLLFTYLILIHENFLRVVGRMRR
jgi:hypothetical protein